MKPWVWAAFTRRPAHTPGMLAELSQLCAALPGYDVIVTSHSPAYRFEAIHRPGVPATRPWWVISTDPADLWRELAACTRYGANNSPEEVASFFTGLHLVPPGIVDARAWQPGWPTPPPFKLRKGQILAGAGTKP